MGIHNTKRRDKISLRASAEMRARTARGIVEAVSAATTELQEVMSRDPKYPTTESAALTALANLRRRQAAVDHAIGEYLAWLQVGGVKRGAMAAALGVRPQTIQRLLAPHEATATARHVDLHRGRGAVWTVERLERLPDLENGDDAA